MTVALQLLSAQGALSFLNAFAGNHLEPVMTIPLMGGGVYDVSAPYDPAQGLRLLETGKQLDAECRILCSHGNPVAIVPGTESQWVVSMQDDLGPKLHYTGKARKAWNKIEVFAREDTFTTFIARESRGRLVGMTLFYTANDKDAQGRPAPPDAWYTIRAIDRQLDSLKLFFSLEQDAPIELLMNQVLIRFGVDLDTMLGAKRAEASGDKLRQWMFEGQFRTDENTEIKFDYQPKTNKHAEQFDIDLYRPMEAIFTLPEVARPLWNWAAADDLIADAP